MPLTQIGMVFGMHRRNLCWGSGCASPRSWRWCHLYLAWVAGRLHVTPWVTLLFQKHYPEFKCAFPDIPVMLSKAECGHTSGAGADGARSQQPRPRLDPALLRNLSVRSQASLLLSLGLTASSPVERGSSELTMLWTSLLWFGESLLHSTLPWVCSQIHAGLCPQVPVLRPSPQLFTFIHSAKYLQGLWLKRGRTLLVPASLSAFAKCSGSYMETLTQERSSHVVILRSVHEMNQAVRRSILQISLLLKGSPE